MAISRSHPADCDCFRSYLVISRGPGVQIETRNSFFRNMCVVHTHVVYSQSSSKSVFLFFLFFFRVMTMIMMRFGWWLTLFLDCSTEQRNGGKPPSFPGFWISLLIFFLWLTGGGGGRHRLPSLSFPLPLPSGALSSARSVCVFESGKEEEKWRKNRRTPFRLGALRAMRWDAMSMAMSLPECGNIWVMWQIDSIRRHLCHR